MAFPSTFLFTLFLLFLYFANQLITNSIVCPHPISQPSSPPQSIKLKYYLIYEKILSTCDLSIM